MFVAPCCAPDVKQVVFGVVVSDVEVLGVVAGSVDVVNEVLAKGFVKSITIHQETS